MVTRRLTLAMIGLVVVTAIAVGWISQYNLEAATLPGELSAISAHARQIATDLQDVTNRVSADVRAARGSAAIDGILRASLAGGIDPRTGLSDTDWRSHLASLFASELAAKPNYLQIRLIGAADGGREIVRVEREAAGGEVKITDVNSLQRKGERPYFRDSINLDSTAVYVSPIELNREHHRVAAPHVPVIRCATPVRTTDGESFGIVVINVDLRPYLANVRPLLDQDASAYLTNAHGDYLVHPDSDRTFGFDLGILHRWTQDHPDLVDLIERDDAQLRTYRDQNGKTVHVAAAPVRLAGGRRVTVIESVPESVLLAPVASVRRACLTGGAVVAVGALVLALVLARSLARPLVRMTASVERFAEDEHFEAPTQTAGEIGVLARTFEQMARTISDRTHALRREIEERRRAEYELARHAERERTYIAVVESSNDAIIATTLDGIITAWNPAAEKLYGYSVEEVIGRDISTIVPPDRRYETAAILDRIWRGERTRQFETARHTKDGQLIDVIISASPVYSPEQQVVGVSMIERDITDQKRAEERFRFAVEAAPCGIFIVGRDGDIVLVNASAERMFGYHRSELVGSSIDMLVPDHVRPRHPELREHYWAQPTPRSPDSITNLTGRRKDGSEFPVEIGLNPFDSPEGARVLCTIVDITQRRLNEKERDKLQTRLRQSEKMEAIGQLAGGVAHDFNNILTTVIGHAELAALQIADEATPTTEIVENLHQIERSALSAADLTRQLLTFGSRQTVNPQVINLNDTLTAIEKMLRRLIRENIDLKFIRAENLPSVLADGGQIEQILINLVVNARDAMPDGGSVIVETRAVVLDEICAAEDPSIQPGEYVMLAVSDTGVGMNLETSKRIFEPFFTTKDFGEGTGLGLATVYGIVKQSDGHINVYSEPGQGTTFRIYLPVIESSNREVAPSILSLPVSALGTETILLCEDDEVVRKLAEVLLTNAGYTVLTASNGAEAVDIVKTHAHDIHLLVSDVIMPGMHGKALADTLHESAPDLRVLFVSGYTANVIVQHGVTEECVELLEKPFTRAALLQRVRRILDASVPHNASTPQPS